MRRQNRSCDQCRKAKRACDAASLKDTELRNGESIVSPSSDDPFSYVIIAGKTSQRSSFPSEDSASPPSCSYCRKTRKQCTFNWARSQLNRRDAAPPQHNGHTVAGGTRRLSEPEPPRGIIKHRRTYRHTNRPAFAPSLSDSQSCTTESESVNLTNSFQQASFSVNELAQSQPCPADPGFLDLSALPDEPFVPLPVIEDLHHTGAFEPGLLPHFSMDSLAESPGGSHVCGPQCSPNCVLSTSAIDDSGDMASWAFFHPHSSSDVSVRPAGHVPSDTSDVLSQDPSAPRFSQSTTSVGIPYRNSLSPFSAEHTTMTLTNNHLISENLMRIYHDVFENALSCWLNEHTCPYKMQPPGEPGRALSTTTRWVTAGPGVVANTHGAEDYEPMRDEFGVAWSNRIYRRVLKLERAAQKTKLTQLSREQDRAASRALHLAMMAFATQWAQGSQRERERYQPIFETATQPGDAATTCAIAEEFDRTIQRSFWCQAKRALQECADLESFKIVCAEIIFGLTLKPDDEGDDFSVFERRESSCCGDDGSNCGNGNGNGEEPLLSRIEGIIAKDGPPIFLERAARKIHNLKFRFDAREMGLDGWLKKKSLAAGPGRGDPIHSMSLEDRRTIGLLYWMALMFDTISSSMNERPVSVSDEDCQHDTTDYETGLQQDPSGTGDYLTNETNGERSNCILWWDELSSRSGNPSSSPPPVLRWPCSYEAAAQAVSGSGPVKVLLFRQVANLQNAVRSGSRGAAVERLIQKALSVYRYWNATYGIFFGDLLEQYDTVSPRIQSWFVCILAHWHLAALILADLIDFVDRHCLADEAAARARRDANVSAGLRRASAEQVADLAKASTTAMFSSPSGRGFSIPPSQMADLHSSVSDSGSILTEPWTMILVRVFSRATVFYLDEAEAGGRRRQDSHTAAKGHEGADRSDAVKKAEECVKALWYLGKKSDMSRKVAEILSKELGPLMLSSRF